MFSYRTPSKTTNSLPPFFGWGRRPFRRAFNFCDDSSLEDKRARISFAGDGVVTLPIQSNDPACTGVVCNIEAVCDIMTDGEIGQEARANSKKSRVSVSHV